MSECENACASERACVNLTMCSILVSEVDKDA